MLCVSDVVRSAYVWCKADSEEGIAAVEYGLLAALIAVVIIAAASLLGTNLSSVFQVVATSIHT